MTDHDPTQRFRFRVRDLLAATALLAAGCAWPVLLFFIVPTLIAAVLARMGYGSSVPVVVAAIASMLAGFAVSYAYLGYVISPPQLLAELQGIAVVEQITRFDGLNAAGVPAANLRGLSTVPLPGTLERNDPGLMPYERILESLEARNLSIQSSNTMGPHDLAGLWQAAEQDEILLAGESGYDDAKKLWGYAGVAKDAAGSELLFLTAMGDQHSNDHYPYYEIAFRRDGPDFQVLNSQQYFEDIAGLEGVGFALWVPVSLFCFVITGPASFLMTIWVKRRRKRAAAAARMAEPAATSVT
jgi:hypothetical protein